MEYYKLAYHKMMDALEAKKLLAGSAELKLEGKEFQWGFDKFADSSLMSFVGNNGTTYKCRAVRRCEEEKPLDEGANKVILGFLLYDSGLIGPLEDKVITELGFERREIKCSNPNMVYVQEINRFVPKCSLN